MSAYNESIKLIRDSCHLTLLSPPAIASSTSSLHFSLCWIVHQLDFHDSLLSAVEFDLQHLAHTCSVFVFLTTYLDLCSKFRSQESNKAAPSLLGPSPTSLRLASRRASTTSIVFLTCFTVSAQDTESGPKAGLATSTQCFTESRS